MSSRRKRYQDPAMRVESGQYKVRYRDQDGRKRVKCFGVVGQVSLAEAKRAKSEFLQQLNDGIVKGLRRDRTLGDLIEKWKLAELPLIKRPGTEKIYLWTFDKLGDLRDAPLAVLAMSDFQIWIAGLNLAASSVRVLRACVSSVMEFGRRDGCIEVNPVRGRMRMPKLVKHRPSVLSPPQVRMLIAELRIEPRTAVLLAVLSGLRKGEMEALTWADVGDLAIDVNKTVNVKGEIGPPKSDSSHRYVEMGPMLSRALQEWRRSSNGSQVFPPARGKFRSLNSVLISSILPVAERVGLPTITWHDMRHTYNTWGRLAGVELEVMRDLMGHSTTAMTANVYSHISRLRPTGSAPRIESLLGVVPPSASSFA